MTGGGGVCGFVVVLGAGVIAVVLSLWGQPLICTCGGVKFWVGSIFDPGNSQHIADWYTTSHIMHGVLIVLLGRRLVPHLSFSGLFAIAILTGVGWEIVEHTDWVLGKFRDTTINQGYTGDSVLNAVADYLFMLMGFFIAWIVPAIWSVLLLIVLELSAALIARDSLVLSTLMLVWPVEAVDQWQQEINPNRTPDA